MPITVGEFSTVNYVACISRILTQGIDPNVVDTKLARQDCSLLERLR